MTTTRHTPRAVATAAAALAGVVLTALAALAPAALASGETREATEDGIRIRTNPSLSATVVGHTIRGQRYQVLAEVEGDRYGPLCQATHGMWAWWRIEFNGGIAYVAMGKDCLTPVITD